jgi:diguanylate cyclase (GGDEF)-like protein
VNKAALLNPEKLLQVIGAQTEIAKLGLDLGGVISFVAERAQSLTNSDGAIVELAEGDEMVYRAGSGLGEPQLGLRLRRQGSLSGLCVETATPLRCDDSETDPRVDREACRRVGLRSMIVAPLVHESNVVGVLKVGARDVGVFGDEHVLVLELMSELIAAAMFNAARYETSELYFRATHDALTGIANRALFYDRLRQSLAQAHRKSELVGILNLDMDGLKVINDHYGHRAGDAAIKETARRIKSVARESDTVARLGGDEFGVVLNRIGGVGDVETHAERIAGRIREPFSFEDNPLTLDASVGSAIYPIDGGEVEELVEKADQSMYRVKRTRRPPRPRPSP